jgi:pimeloyl-ACP methyl ester carboxylesterase
VGKWSTAVARDVVTRDGTRLHVLLWPGQRGAGPPFLLVHGLASNCRTWEQVGDLLSDAGHAVAALDQRGHGRSDKPEHGYDFSTMCGDLLDVLDDLGYERPVVAGQSTGGNMAVELAGRVGERLAGVVGVDGGVLELAEQWPDWDDCAWALAPPNVSDLRVAQVEDAIRREHPSWSDRGVAGALANYEPLSDGTVRPRLSRDHHMDLLRSLWEHRPSVVIPRLRVPLLLALADTGDEWVPAKRTQAARARRLAPRCRVHWFAPSDHDIHVEHPAELAAVLSGACVEGFFARNVA